MCYFRNVFLLWGFYKPDKVTVSSFWLRSQGFIGRCFTYEIIKQYPGLRRNFGVFIILKIRIFQRL
jgi:hypothetical protein